MASLSIAEAKGEMDRKQKTHPEDSGRVEGAGVSARSLSSGSLPYASIPPDPKGRGGDGRDGDGAGALTEA